jgi:hypothetical protein
MSRILGFAIVIAWAVAFTAVVLRDVAPYLRPQEPPRGHMPSGDYQVGILDSHGRRIGTSWTTLSNQPEMLTVQSSTHLEDLTPLRGLLAVRDLLIDSSFSISLPDRRLTSFDVSVRHDREEIARLVGHQVGEDYACTARVGTLERAFSLDARATSLISEAVRPFDHLPNLRVGQTWRIRMVDFVALLRDQTAAIAPQLVQVTRRETIEHGSRRVECFRIETDGATAWADRSGRVLLQHVELPLLGRLEIRDEPFDVTARNAIRRRTHGATEHIHDQPAGAR